MTASRTPLSLTEIAEALPSLPGWRHEDNALVREWTFPHFRAAFAFMTQVAMLAERLDHHPDWSNSWNRVTIRLCTHDAGRVVTALDVELARRIGAITD